jgi:6-pyruvoyl-tetrahydropterin synthase
VGEVRLDFRLKRKHKHCVHVKKRTDQTNTTLETCLLFIWLRVKFHVTYIQYSGYSNKQLSVCVTDSMLSVKLTYSEPVEEEQADGT